MFSILDHKKSLNIIEEHNTWFKAECPICGGNLKVNKLSGAYACYTNHCEGNRQDINTNKIRNLLNKPSPFKQRSPFSLSSLFSNENQKRLIEVVKPKAISCESSAFSTNVAWTRPRQKQVNGSILTCYQYTDTFRIIRVDYLGKKTIHMEYLDMDKGKWQVGLPCKIPNKLCYRPEYLQPNIVVVEGEKCAAVAQRIGLAAICIPYFIYSEGYLNRYVSQLASDCKLENVLVLADNDDVGRKKAKTLATYFWKYNVGSTILNLAPFLGKQDTPGYDIYDAVIDKKIRVSNIISVLGELINASTHE